MLQLLLLLIRPSLFAYLPLLLLTDEVHPPSLLFDTLFSIY